MKPKLTVIVPVYNAEKYLPRCLDSILNQTIKEIEIILVNDGSADDSERVCREYADRYSGIIRVFSQKNSGQSVARNVGLRMASADMIGFVDSDDFIDENMYEYLLQIKEENCAQIAVGGVKMETAEGQVYKVRAVDKECVLDRHDAMKEVLYSKRVLNSLCNKVFDRNLFDGLSFPEGQIYEDAYMIYDFFHRAERVAFTDQVFYHYCENQRSTTHRAFSEREFDRVKASLKKVDFIGKEYPDLLPLAEQYLVYDCMMTMSKMEKYDHKYDVLLKDNLRKYWRSFIKSDHSLSAKAYVVTARFCPGLAVRINRFLPKH